MEELNILTRPLLGAQLYSRRVRNRGPCVSGRGGMLSSRRLLPRFQVVPSTLRRAILRLVESLSKEFLRHKDDGYDGEDKEHQTQQGIIVLRFAGQCEAPIRMSQLRLSDFG